MREAECMRGPGEKEGNGEKRRPEGGKIGDEGAGSVSSSLGSRKNGEGAD